MCGIAGIISSNTQLISKERIRSATNCLRHRGPENEGLWIDPENNIALGHSRLSIIDHSEAAAQPMQYLDRYSIVHNGELYNYIEIRDQLKEKGHQFLSNSDTEVIIAAYHEWGSNCLQQFDGMFAFAIWDQHERQLFAARDRLGEKPFFFSYDAQQFVFASEIKSLWNLGVDKEVNRGMLYNFLTIGYTTNPGDPLETFYQHISKLPAANYLRYAVPSKELVIEKYWQFYPEEKNISEESAIEQFRSLFSRSIKRRLRSDVSVGTSLSGGLDSSSIVAFCDQQVSDNYSHKCFTASFEGFDKDELRYASSVASQFGLEHYIVTVTEAEITDLMQEVMSYQEEPFASGSVLAQYKVFQAAKQNGVTVLLDGQGADEILAGYHKYYKWYWQELYRTKKLRASGELKNAEALGLGQSFGLKNKIAALFPEFAAGILQSGKERKAFHHPDLDRDFAFSNKRNLYYALPPEFTLNSALYFNTVVIGLEELLRLADRNSMAHAVEVRLPFLNHQLVEFLFSLPPHLKIREGWTKWLLRKSTGNMLPEDIRWRRSKIGFEPPQKKWMENKTVQDAIRQAKKKLADQGILNTSALNKKIKPHDAHAADNWDWKSWSASFLFP